jgi:hypothetical protein
MPLVGVFIWYSDRLNTKFQEFLREERKARETQLDKLTNEMTRLASAYEVHDSKFDQAVAVMKERTQPKRD